MDPRDLGARVNLGQLLLQERRYPEAIEELRAAVAAEPYNATAVYNLGLALVRSGQAEEGQQAMERFRQPARKRVRDAPRPDLSGAGPLRGGHAPPPARRRSW